MEKNIELLEKEFRGSGEVAEINFKQIAKSDTAYIYQCGDSEFPYFEVIKRQSTAKCIDFDKRIYSETEFKERYPKSAAFGLSAWSCKTLKQAKSKFKQI